MDETLTLEINFDPNHFTAQEIQEAVTQKMSEISMSGGSGVPAPRVIVAGGPQSEQ